MVAEQMQVVIAGAGGMGALFGSILQEGGLHVTLLDSNPAHVAAINEHGLSITGFGGERTVAMKATTDAASIANADFILFQCKAHGTAEAARSVMHLVDGGAVCISFQNGLGNEKTIANIVGEPHVLGGLTAMAGYMLAPGQIRDFSRVPSWIGEMRGGTSERVERIASVLSGAGLETHSSADITHSIWKKLLGNIAMSAVSGATNLTAAQCLSVPELKATSLRALDEALTVAAAEGIDLSRDETVEGMEMISCAGGTGDNKSSLCADLLNRRPTEVDYIYGSVIACAKKHAVPVPTLVTLSSIIKGLESHYMQKIAEVDPS